MRLTCLKCGHQMEVATGADRLRINCVCGNDFTHPEVVNTGTCPNERAAERSRSRAFRAAGLVKNVGGFALGIALLGVIFFPLGLLGAIIGVYTLTMVRGPLGRYSGRRQAMFAVAIGVTAFVGEGAAAMFLLEQRQLKEMELFQDGAREDLRALLRAERLFRATHDTYGSFREFRFRPPSGRYTIYLHPDDAVDSRRGENGVRDPLPAELRPAVSESAFTAVAVANIDGDEFLDVWMLTDHGDIEHVMNDVDNSMGVELLADEPAEANESDLGVEDPPGESQDDAQTKDEPQQAQEVQPEVAVEPAEIEPQRKPKFDAAPAVERAPPVEVETQGAHAAESEDGGQEPSASAVRDEVIPEDSGSPFRPVDSIPDSPKAPQPEEE